MNLFDIVSKEKWHKMQEGFSKALGVSIQVLDKDGKFLMGSETKNSFCFNILKLSGKNSKIKCKECISKLIDKIKDSKNYDYLICPLDLYLYAIPIHTKDRFLQGHVVIGPVMLHKQKSVGEYEKISNNEKIPLNDLLDKLLMVKRFSFAGIESTVELIQEVVNDIIQLNYDTKRLKEKFYIKSPLGNVIKDMYESFCFDEFLNALLEVSLNASKGDAGSIMVLDQDKDELSMQCSRGLKENYNKYEKIRMGDGISGLVAKNEKPLLIDGSLKDSRIKNRLKRPYIKSSIIYPLKVGNRIFGVLNLNNIKGKKTFNSETLDLVGNLTRLTRFALEILPRKAS
ncbi:PocR ligand-binding domain-containing protein [Candidatus Omnitrophota bacterium]